MTAEIWKPVAGWEGLYEVSDLGRVRSYRKTHVKRSELPAVIKSHATRGGYMRVRLFLQNRRHYASVHRLVCQAFLGDCPEGMQVNHKNGIRHDNRLENLEYVTPRENNLHALYELNKLATLPRGEANKASKLTEADVIRIRELWASGDYKRREIAEIFGISRTSVTRIVKGRGWKHVGGGYE